MVSHGHNQLLGVEYVYACKKQKHGGFGSLGDYLNT